MDWIPFVVYCLPFNSQPLPAICSHDDSETIQKEEKGPNSKKQQAESERWEIYLQLFSIEIVKSMEKFEKKNWKEEENNMLISLRNKGLNWVEISKQIEKTNPQVCKRRYVRLIENEKKCPKIVDDFIKNGYENEGLDWISIQKTIAESNFDESMFYSVKKIKERYFFHLRDGIDSRNWELSEDLKLLNLIKDHGKKWKAFTENFHSRTELQLKNRYNGTLKLMEKRVTRKLNAFLKKKKENKKTKIEFQ